MQKDVGVGAEGFATRDAEVFLKRTAIAYDQNLTLLLGSRWYVPEYSGSSLLKTLQGHGTSMILDRILVRQGSYIPCGRS